MCVCVSVCRVESISKVIPIGEKLEKVRTDRSLHVYYTRGFISNNQQVPARKVNGLPVLKSVLQPADQFIVEDKENSALIVFFLKVFHVLSLSLSRSDA